MLDFKDRPAPLNLNNLEFAEVAKQAHEHVLNERRSRLIIYGLPSLLAAIGVDGGSPYRAIGAGAAVLSAYAFQKFMPLPGRFLRNANFISTAKEIGTETASEAVENYAPYSIAIAEPESKLRKQWFKENDLLTTMITFANYRKGTKKNEEASSSVSTKYGCALVLFGMATYPVNAYVGYKGGTFVGNHVATYFNPARPQDALTAKPAALTKK